MKHYIIWNLSCEWDDIYGESIPTIEYICSDLEDAISYFNEKFGKTPSMPNDKWKYEYVLKAYIDGYSRLNYYEDDVQEIKRICNY